MEERNLFIVWDDVTDETVLAVLAAIQAYEKASIEKNKAWNRIHKINRELIVKTYIVCKERYLFIFNRCLDTVVDMQEKIDPFLKMNFTYVCALSISTATALAKNTDKPLALALGIMLGCEASTLANVDNLCTEYTITKDILLEGKLDSYTKESNVHHFINFDSSLEDKIKGVYSSKIVVGYSSFETYLACCLKKPVLEIQLNPLLYKWSNKGYNCITEESNLQELIPKGIAQCLQQATIPSV
jgi:hypothetical protein